jgi:hypothetical protein
MTTVASKLEGRAVRQQALAVMLLPPAAADPLRQE